MEEFNVGDIVVYEGAEFLVVAFDEINEQFVIEPTNLDEATAEDQFGVDPENLTLASDEASDDEVHVEDENLEEDEELNELTAAGKTIQGKANYNLSAMTGNDILAAAKGSSSQLDFFAKMMALYGKGKDWGVGNPSAANKNSIDMKASAASGKTVAKLTETELAEILSAEEGLSEEFKTNAATLFEAAISLRVSEARAELQEEFDVQAEALATELEEQMEQLTSTVSEQVDEYLSYVAEQWVAENELAVETDLKTELTESFMSGLKQLFDDHYIDVPSEQVDVVESMAHKIAELEESLDDQINSNLELIHAVEEYGADEVFDEVSEGLAMTEMEKFRTLSEGVEFDGDEDEYRAKLAIIKTKYFTEALVQTNLNEEVIDGEPVVVNNADVDPRVAAYAMAVPKREA